MINIAQMDKWINDLLFNSGKGRHSGDNCYVKIFEFLLHGCPAGHHLEYSQVTDAHIWV